MAYPMMKHWPTFSEFRAKVVEQYGGSYKQLPGSLCINDGEPGPIFYLERESGGAVRRYSVAIQDSEQLSPSVLRSLCKRLDIDPKDFGLTLG